MFGKNIIMKQDLQADLFWVQEIFYTIQGEGPYAGRAATFIRLAGCNLRCFFCDTDFESSDLEMSEKQILAECQKYPTKLVVITGGEPFRQNLLKLCTPLWEAGFEVQIETAGTLWQKGMERGILEHKLTIVCSPKTGTINQNIEMFCEDWKYIIRKGEVDEVDGLPNMSTQKKDTPLKIYRAEHGTIWLQPMMEYYEGGDIDYARTHENTQLCAQLAMKHDYRITLQMHKLLGLP